MHHTILRNELVKCGKKLSDRLVGTMMARPTGVEGGQENPPRLVRRGGQASLAESWGFEPQIGFGPILA